MVHVKIDTSQIVDWNSLHDVFAQAFGFPETYGRNMNAWIESMLNLDNPAAGMTAMHLQPGETLALELSDASDFSLRCEDLYDAVVECAAYVNHHRLKNGKSPVIALAYVRARS